MAEYLIILSSQLKQGDTVMDNANKIFTVLDKWTLDSYLRGKVIEVEFQKNDGTYDSYIFNPDDKVKLLSRVTKSGNETYAPNINLDE